MDTNRFANEEKNSSHVYPAGYKVKGITKQTNILRQLFPEIGIANEKLAEQLLPANAEGWFAIPRWQKLDLTYNEAVERVLGLIKKQRKGKFYNWREYKLGKQYLRQHKHTVKKLRTLGEQQKNHDIMVVACQFGLCHKGRSVRRAREVFMTNEFGLGAFEIGCMLLTHPKRLVSNGNLWINCAGDEYSLDADGQFEGAPYFLFSNNDVRFDTYCTSHVSSIYGSVSAFLPQ